MRLRTALVLAAAAGAGAIAVARWLLEPIEMGHPDDRPITRREARAMVLGMVERAGSPLTERRDLTPRPVTRRPDPEMPFMRSPNPEQPMQGGASGPVSAAEALTDLQRRRTPMSEEHRARLLHILGDDEPGQHLSGADLARLEGELPPGALE